jgi:hypothetical protein
MEPPEMYFHGAPIYVDERLPHGTLFNLSPGIIQTADMYGDWIVSRG